MFGLARVGVAGEWLRTGGARPRADVSAVGVYGGGVYDHGGVCVVFEHECGGVEEVRPGNEARFVPAASVRMLEGAGRLWRRLTKFDWLQRSRSTLQWGLVTELVLQAMVWGSPLLVKMEQDHGRGTKLFRVKGDLSVGLFASVDETQVHLFVHIAIVQR